MTLSILIRAQHTHTHTKYTRRSHVCFKSVCCCEKYEVCLFYPQTVLNVAVIIIKFHTKIICSFWHFSRFISSSLVCVCAFFLSYSLLVLDAFTIFPPNFSICHFAFYLHCNRNHNTIPTRLTVWCCCCCFWGCWVIWQGVLRKNDPSLIRIFFFSLSISQCLPFHCISLLLFFFQFVQLKADLVRI